MKKSHLVKRGVQDAAPTSSQPDKVGWIRKFCGKGVFREIWKNRFVMLKGDYLYIFEKEVKNNGKTHEVFDLAEYERSEEVRKAKSRSKKNYSKFTLLRCRQPGVRTSHLVFLAVSPEEKESWINVLNSAITRAKNRVLDEVTIEEDSLLSHPTRDRAKIPLGRRLPTRGHLMAVASTSSDGMLTLDLVNEEDAGMLEHEHAVWVKDHRGNLDLLAPARRRADTDVSRPRETLIEGKVKTSSLPRESELSWSQESQTHTPQQKKKSIAHDKNHCGSPDNTSLTKDLQDIIAQRLQRTQEILAEIQGQEPQKGRMGYCPYQRGIDSPWLCHIKGSDSPKSKSSSSCSSTGKSIDSSSQIKASSKLKESPCVKGKDSPHSKSSKSSYYKDRFCSKSVDSPDSKVSFSPIMKCIDLTHIKGSDSPVSTGNNSPKTVDSPCVWLLSSPHFKVMKDTETCTELLGWESKRAETERLLQEAVTLWEEAKEVLAEVKELQARQRQGEQNKSPAPLKLSENKKQETT